MQEVSVLVFFNGSLHFVEGLLNELAILDVKDAVGVAFNLWVVSDHHASCCTVLTFALRSNSVDVENQVHDSNYLAEMTDRLAHLSNEIAVLTS